MVKSLNSDHIIHGPRILCVLLTLVFNSTLAPMPNDKRQLECTSDNLTAIIRNSIVAKLFDVIILSKEQYTLATLHLQFENKMCPLLIAHML